MSISSASLRLFGHKYLNRLLSGSLSVGMPMLLWPQAHAERTCLGIQYIEFWLVSSNKGMLRRTLLSFLATLVIEDVRTLLFLDQLVIGTVIWLQPLIANLT